MTFHPAAAVWGEERADEAPCRRCGALGRLWVAEAASGPYRGPWCTLRCWGTDADERAQITGRPRARRGRAAPPAWATVVRSWPATGAPGITETSDRYGEVLLYRDVGGTLLGVLWHHGQQIRVLVAPDRRRHGIGKALVRAAGRRWPINLTAQRLTDAGAALTRAALPRTRTHG